MDTLMQDVENVLDETGYSYCEYSGCFDIAARKKSMMLIKVLSNVDSFQKGQADNLKIVSKSLDAKVVIVGKCTRREKLSDNVVYERFDVPAVTLRTFEGIAAGDGLPSIYRFRGGLFVEIDPENLRAARNSMHMTQAGLAERTGVTKKSVYEHEKKKISMEYKSAVRIEKILKKSLITPFDVEPDFDMPLSQPATNFESRVSRKFTRLGFDARSVYKSPFNMIAKDGKSILLSDVAENAPKTDKRVTQIKEFSGISGKPAVMITKTEKDFDMKTITEKEFLEMEKSDIRKLTRK